MIRPPHIAKQSENPFPCVSMSEFRGVRSLHFTAEAIQGSMRIAVPDQIELTYVQQMMVWLLFYDPLNIPVKHVVQLGLGAASLTKFCYAHLPDARVTAIELNPAVITACYEWFKLSPDDDRLQVIEMDALDYVRNVKNQGKIDVLQVDLYDAKAKGPVLDTPDFYQACADCLTDDGVMTVNLFSDAENRQKNILAMESAFDAVAWLPEVHDANVVAIAFKRAPQIDFDLLYQRAAVIRVNMKLPTAHWVNGLKEWMVPD